MSHAEQTQRGGRCPKRCPNTPLPAGFPLEAAQTHPRYRYYLTPGAQCEHEQGHADAHRNGLLVWWDPPRLVLARDLDHDRVPAQLGASRGETVERVSNSSARALESVADASQHAAVERGRGELVADRGDAGSVGHKPKSRRRPR